MSAGECSLPPETIGKSNFDPSQTRFATVSEIASQTHLEAFSQVDSRWIDVGMRVRKAWQPTFSALSLTFSPDTDNHHVFQRLTRILMGALRCRNGMEAKSCQFLQYAIDGLNGGRMDCNEIEFIRTSSLNMTQDSKKRSADAPSFVWAAQCETICTAWCQIFPI